MNKTGLIVYNLLMGNWKIFIIIIITAEPFLRAEWRICNTNKTVFYKWNMWMPLLLSTSYCKFWLFTWIKPNNNYKVY